MANVQWTLDAESSSAVQAFLKLVDAQKKTEDGAHKAAAAHDHAHGMVEKFAHGFEAVESIAGPILEHVIELAEKMSESLKEGMEHFAALTDASKGAASQPGNLG